jgi:hypothetical protein
MKRVFVYFLIAALLPLMTLRADAEEVSQKKVEKFFEKLMNYTDEDISQLFSQSFLNQVPAATLEQYLVLFNEKYGQFQKAEVTGGKDIRIYYEEATMPGKIGFDSEGKIVTLWFGRPVMKADSFEKIKSELDKIKGDKSVCITKNGEVIFDIEMDKPMAVGSTFKLYVLKTLRRKVREVEIMWQDVIRLDSEKKSLPSGIIQKWPAGSPLTIRTLANLMISISDNTATDILIHLLGRDEIEKDAPETMRPFLTTMEMFKLKFSDNDEIAEKYAEANEHERRNILKELENISRDQVDEDNIDKPVYVSEIEWIVSTRELCSLISEIKDSPSITINPGLADIDKWHYIGYKGGSEPGVLNYTHLLQDKEDGDVFAISATINDDEIVDSDKQFTMLVTRMIELLREK